MLPEDMLIHEMTIANDKGDGALAPIIGKPYTVRGFFQNKRNLVRSKDSKEVASTAMFFMDNRPDVNTNPTVDSTAEFEGIKYQIVQVDRVDDPTSSDKLGHLELMLK